jgi:hypothetical protein
MLILAHELRHTKKIRHHYKQLVNSVLERNRCLFREPYEAHACAGSAQDM